MKLQALMIAVALAAGGAFAQAPGNTPASANASPTAAAAAADAGTAGKAADKKDKKEKKVVKKKDKAQAHQHHSNARMRHDHAGAMGAGAASPDTDLLADAREQRIADAYANWLALQGRR